MSSEKQITCKKRCINWQISDWNLKIFSLFYHVYQYCIHIEIMSNHMFNGNLLPIQTIEKTIAELKKSKVLQFDNQGNFLYIKVKIPLLNVYLYNWKVINNWNIFFQLIFDESFTYFYVSPHRWHDFDFFLSSYDATGIQTHVSSVAAPLRDLFQDAFTYLPTAAGAALRT